MTNDSEIVLYQPDNSINMEVLLENETLWLTLDNLSMLYQRDKSTISRHIKNIFKEGELQPYAVVANFATTASDLIRRAKHEIILIDNYIDESVLTMLNKRNDGVKATIYTANFSKDLKLDLQKHNTQYQPIDIKVYKNSHDRFLIIDDVVYHIGASLKDLGKKLFAFSRLQIEKEKIL